MRATHTPSIRRGRAAEYAFVLAGTAIYASLLVFYLGSPAFKDHVEPAVGAVAGALLRGQPPYHGLTGEESYELPYGPAAFAVHAVAFAVLGPSTASLKAPGLLACAGAAAITFAVLLRRTSLRCASGGILILVVYLAYYDARAYWCRPEPFLLLGSAAALWVARRKPRWALPALAVLVAWTIDLKVTGPLYLAPVAVLVAETHGPRGTAVAVAAGVVLGFAVFAFPPLSLEAYAALLASTARHGLSAHELLLNASAAALLLVPAFVARGLRQRGPPVPPQRASWSVPARTLVASALAVCVIAAKPGAGRHHLVPFLPLAIDALADAADGIERGRLPARAAAMSTLAVRALGCALIAVLVLGSAARLAAGAPRARQDDRDLRAILDAHAGDDISMGYGDAASYADTFSRAALEAPLRLDGASQMDRAASGLSADRMLGAGLEACRPRYWILPGGEPFSLQSYYAGSPVFDAAFRAAFARRYELVETRGAYRVYRCR
jgi:hypothetical protein